jgi:MFS family permease
MPSIYKDVYDFNELEIGLAYLPGGAGVILGSFVTGKLMDRSYALTAKEISRTIDKVHGDDLDSFPIEKARSRPSWYMIGIGTYTLIGYGWSVVASAHPSIPMLLQCVMGFVCTFFFQAFNALLADIFPENPSTAATSGNIARCALAGAGVAIAEPLTAAIGRGWFFTFLSLLSGGAGAGAIWTLQAHGMRWRGERRSKAMYARKPSNAERAETSNNEKSARGLDEAASIVSDPIPAAPHDESKERS